MPHKELLGRFVTLEIARFGPPGAFLAIDPADRRPGAPVILLPGSDAPNDAAVGASLEVFVYLDSEDRPVATRRAPKLTVGEVAFLTVTDVTGFGAFVDWGMPKELLVPRGEQTRDLRVGDRHPIGLYVDDTGRLAGTMRVSEKLRGVGEFVLDAWVDGEAWRSDPDIGVFVIVERRFVGLLPAGEPHTLTRGQAARFRVANVLRDGKIELSLRGHAHEEVLGDAQKILDTLGRLQGSGAARVGDRSSPDEIRAVFGLSKKTFKRVVGHLLKQGAVDIDREGFLALRAPTTPEAPGPSPSRPR